MTARFLMDLPAASLALWDLAAGLLRRPSGVPDSEEFPEGGKLSTPVVIAAQMDAERLFGRDTCVLSSVILSTELRHSANDGGRRDAQSADDFSQIFCHWRK